MKRLLFLNLCLMMSLIPLNAQEQQRGKTFVQASLTEMTFYGSQERGLDLPQGLFKGFRSSTGFSLAIGRWVSPEVGLRLKFNGLNYKTIISDNSDENSSRYFALFGDVLLNASTLLFGENENRCWDVTPFVGGGFNRNFTYDEYGIGLRGGLLNSWHLDKHWSLHFEIVYSIFEPDADGLDPQIKVKFNGGRHSIQNRDRNLGVELGVTYHFGK